MIVELNEENKTVKITADCPAGATSGKIYRNGNYFSTAYLENGKLFKVMAQPAGSSFRVGISALFGSIESEIAEKTVTPTTPLFESLDSLVYVPSQGRLAGEYTGDIDHVVVYVNGKPKETGGEFTEEETFELPLDITIKPTDKIEVEGLDSNNEVVVEKQPVEVVKDLTITE